MFKNPNYIYGPRQEVLVPSSLQYGEFLLKKMWQAKEKVALENAATGQSTTYYDICQRGMNFAVFLRHLGLRKGQTVAICSENRLEFFDVVLGIACAGGVIATIGPEYVADQVRHVMSLSKPKFVVCSPHAYKQHGRLFKSLHAENVILLGNDKEEGALFYNDLTLPVKEDSKEVIADGKLMRNVTYDEFEVVEVKGQLDTLFISYTSGTTGLPKAVMLSHLNVLTMCNIIMLTRPTDHSEVRLLLITPWIHNLGLIRALISLTLTDTSVFLPWFEVDLFLKTIEKYEINQLLVVPLILVELFKSPKKYDLSSVKLIYCGGAPLHKVTADLVNATFSNVHVVYQGYGITESTLALMSEVEGELHKPGSVGKVIPQITVKVVDIDTRKPLGPNQHGEICVKGPIVMQGYIGKDPKEVFDEEGFFPSGDIGYYDEDKYFFIVDRLKDMIKYKDYMVSPVKLEGLLLKHEAVQDVGVVGIPHGAAGEVPVAFVVVQPDKKVTEEELKKFVADKSSNPKHVLGGVRFVSAIPKKLSGKILRYKLKKIAQSSSIKL